MKTFAYTYRNTSGALKRASLQALDRSDALRQIQAQGHVPVSVTEGFAKRSEAASLLPFFSTRIAKAVACAALVFFAVLIGLRFFLKTPLSSGETPSDSKNQVVVPLQKQKSPETLSDNFSGDAPSKSQSATPSQAHSEPTVQQKAYKQKIFHKLSDNKDESQKEDEPLFEMKSTTEDLLSMLASSQLGEDPMPMPMPFGSDDEANSDALDAMRNVIEITTNDLPRDELRKEAIAWTKLDLKEYIAKGGSAKEFLEKTYDVRKQIAEYRNQDVEELAKFAKDKEPEEIQAKLDEVNASYKADGILPITLEDLEGWDD